MVKILWDSNPHLRPHLGQHATYYTITLIPATLFQHCTDAFETGCTLWHNSYGFILTTRFTINITIVKIKLCS